MGMAARLGEACRRAREQAGLTALDISTATVAHSATGERISESTVSRFERGLGWSLSTDELVATYEAELGLPDGELWRRAIDQ